MFCATETLEPRRLLAGVALVKDVNDGSLSSWPTRAVEYNGFAYFVAKPSSWSSALYRTDGTTGGTVKIKDLRDSLSPINQSTSRIRVCNGLIYFTDAIQNQGQTFYRSDGTSEGTYPVPGAPAPYGMKLAPLGDRIFYPVNTGSEFVLYYLDSMGAHPVPGPSLGTSVDDLFAFNNAIYFRGYDATHGYELWRTDGTSTSMVADIDPTTPASPTGFCVFNGSLYFAANDAAHGVELWRTDGTAAGTTLAADINVGTGSSSPANLFAGTTALYFAAYRPNVGKELFASNGSTTALVADLRSGSGSSNPRAFSLAGERVVFACEKTFSVLTQHVTQGTAASTLILNSQGVGGTECVAVGSHVYFNDDALQSLWRTDGTPAGTTRLTTFANEAMPIQSFSAYGTSLFFGGYDLNNEIEPWMSNGTAASTRLLKDLSVPSDDAGPANFAVSNDHLYFTASTKTELGTKDSVFVSDGSTLGTSMSASAMAGVFSGPTNLTDVEGRLFFFAVDPAGTGMIRLLCSDGAGTVPRVILNSASGNQFISGSARSINGMLIFAMREGGIGYTLWQSDGITATRLKVLSSGNISNAAPPSNFIAAGSQVYFFADGDNNGYQELWRTDASEGGTWMVSDASVYYSSPSGSSVQTELMGSELWFLSSSVEVNGSVGRLYRTDGTPDGTHIISTFRAPVTGNTIRAAKVGPRMYFLATGLDDPNDGSDLWATDGTAAGTHRVKSFEQHTPAWLQTVGSNLFFTAWSSVSGVELWTTDGSEIGTHLVKDLTAGTGSSNLFALTEHNGLLYFGFSETGAFGEVWRSNGSESGTAQVTDIRPGPEGSVSNSLNHFVKYKGELYWPGGGDEYGIELRKWDEFAPGLAISSGFDPDTQTMRLVFNEALSAAPPAGSIHVHDEGSLNQVEFSTSYFAATNTVVLSGLTSLADGNYRVTIDAGAVVDGVGNATPFAFTLDFFSFLADANRDRRVNTSDFNILAGNFGAAGKKFSEGNFDYDPAGAVNSVDFVILAMQYGKSVVPAAYAPMSANAGSTASLEMVDEEDPINGLIELGAN